MQAQPAAQSRSWEDYRAHLRQRAPREATASRSGERTARALERAERTYGVPAEIIVAIIGVETFYGRNTGRWRVIDALATLAFDYPPRAPFFRGELEQYLLFAREMRARRVLACGLLRRRDRHSAVHADQLPALRGGLRRRRRRSDLRGNAADAVGSVGNFLKQHGWQPGEPVQLRGARRTAKPWRATPTAISLPRHSLAELTRAGVEARARGAAGGHARRAARAAVAASGRTSTASACTTSTCSRATTAARSTHRGVRSGGGAARRPHEGGRTR